MIQTIPKLGIGAGWRPELALALQRYGNLGFLELVAEDFDPDGVLPAPVTEFAGSGRPIIPHGVSLSLGSAEPPDPKRLNRLARMATRLNSPLVSEHLAFVRAGGMESGHLLPLPRTNSAMQIVVDNIRRAQDALPVPLVLENVATLVEWPDPEMDEAAFFGEIVEQADVLLLLDVENVYANSRNHGYDPVRFMERLPLNRLAYVHVAGGDDNGDMYHDTHTYPVPKPVFELLEELSARTEIPGVMLERDGDWPPESELHHDLNEIAESVERGRQRRESCRERK